MSLVSYASVWTNDDDPNNTTKKRVASLRKTIKKPPPSVKPVSDIDEYNNHELLEQSEEIPNFQNDQVQYNDRLNQIVDKMTTLSQDNDGQGLANFTPLPNPIINKKTDVENDKNVNGKPADIPLSYQSNSMQIPPPVLRRGSESTNFISHLPDLGNVYSSYQRSYEAPRELARPYSAITSNQSQQYANSDKFMEKINYMIHLLEQQHNEKTSNVMEEFILYTFLGVFIIFIVDSFARAGKYTR
jgi:hypothetical protein